MFTFLITYIPAGWSEPDTRSYTTDTADFGYACDEAINTGWQLGEPIEVRHVPDGARFGQPVYRNPSYCDQDDVAYADQRYRTAEQRFGIEAEGME
jgi:hypothetical protein